jgi:hypothetical protein
MGYKMASVTFWVPHTTLEKKVKCAKNNPNHKPNVPLVIEEEPHSAPYMGQDGAIYTFLYKAIFHVKMLFFLQ